jgi:uncharacterized surface protein with fasciclin (FAS1) repeats
MRSIVLSTALVAIAAVMLAGCSSESTNVTAPVAENSLARGANERPSADNTIYDIAKAASTGAEPEFTILVAALEAAGLDTALDGKGQFTVFAPTDAAFGKLFANPDFPLTPEELLANKELLTSVLLYHVARGNRDSGDVVSSSRIRMMAKSFTFPVLDAGSVYLRDTSALTDDAQIIKVDIPASNGVIHVIDEVLLP